MSQHPDKPVATNVALVEHHFSGNIFLECVFSARPLSVCLAKAQLLFPFRIYANSTEYGIKAAAVMFPIQIHQVSLLLLSLFQKLEYVALENFSRP